MLEAIQTASGESVFTRSRQWEGQSINGTYPLRQYLGGTNHSAVFLTEIPGQSAQRAAIKLFSPSGDLDTQLGRSRLAAELSHAHLLRIFKVGRTHLAGDDLLFVVTELAEETLSQILPQRALTPAEIGEMLKPSLEALSYLHQNGFAHGHVKPSNIMVVAERLKLSSDGLSRPGTRVSSVGVYDPPELATEGCSPAGDVWSLGMTLVHALTQHLPKWTNRLQSEPTLPDKMPEPFADIIGHCLLRDPRSRWTIAEITERLQTPAKAAQAQRSSKPTWETSKIRKQLKHWVYVIPIAAMVAIILLLGSLLHRKPASPPDRTTALSAAKTSTRQSHSPGVAKAAPAFDPSQIVQQVVPDPPEKALRTIKGKIKVNIKVHIDGNGNVARAQLVSAGPSRYFARLAMQAAHDWRFTPATRDTSPEWVLQFAFERTGASVQPRPIA